VSRILLDECVDRRVVPAIAGHTVSTVHALRWTGLSDAALLRRAEAEFDILVTTDQSLRFQQNLAQFRLGFVVLKARSNRLQDLLPLVPGLLDALRSVAPGEVVEISPPPSP